MSTIPRLELTAIRHLLAPEVTSVVAPAINGGIATEIRLVRVERKTGDMVFFGCPTCGSRARYLFNITDVWACGKCHNLDDPPARHLSNKRRHERQITILSVKLQAATDDVVREYLTDCIERHRAALAVPHKPLWSQARRHRRTMSVDPHKQLYGNKSHLAGQRTPHSQVAYDAPPSTAYDRKTSVARAIIEQNAKCENAPSIFREVATRDDTPVVAEAHEEHEHERERIRAEYERRGMGDAYYERAPELPDGNPEPRILPARENPFWMNSDMPYPGDAIRRWHEG